MIGQFFFFTIESIVVRVGAGPEVFLGETVCWNGVVRQLTTPTPATPMLLLWTVSCKPCNWKWLVVTCENFVIICSISNEQRKSQAKTST